MRQTPDFGPLDVTDFTIGAMLRSGIAIRRIVRGTGSFEAAADAIVRYLYEHCVDGETGDRSCAMVRFYKTHPFAALREAQQEAALRQLGDAVSHPEMRCLTLLASAGDEAEWNSRHESRGHKAIPMASAEMVRGAPMIARLIEELGLDIDSVVSGDASEHEPASRTYDVFHVEDAVGNPYIPAQAEFVVKYRIASVVGFGGLLRSGEMFSVVLFSRARIPVSSAARFRTIALDVRSALFSFDESQVWR